MSELAPLVISRDDLADRHAWSGIPRMMYRALGEEFGDVRRCDGLGYPRGLGVRVENRMLRLVGVNSYWRLRTAQYHSRQIEERLAAERRGDCETRYGIAERSGDEVPAYGMWGSAALRCESFSSGDSVSGQERCGGQGAS